MSTPAEGRSSAAVPVVRLADLPELARELVARVHNSGFRPDVVVYVETGARLLARETGVLLGVPTVPVWVSRGGRRAKRIIAPFAARLPLWLRDWLRGVEERSQIHRLTSRKTTFPAAAAFTGQRVLLLDDAADTGRTISTVRALLLARGVAAVDLRAAVLAATTRPGRAAVDYFLWDCACRMPWSSDSDEREAAERLAEQHRPDHARGGI